MINTVKNWVQKCTKKISTKLAAKVFGGLFLVYLLLGYFAVNPLAKRIVPSLAESSLGSKASVGRVEFDPFRLKATIEDFNLAEKNGKSLAGFKKLVVDFELSGMFDRAWKFKQISISEPVANVAIGTSGQLNWDALLDKLSEGESAPSDTIPRLIIQHIIVSQGKVKYTDTDRPVPIKTTLAPLSFQLKGFSTLPKDRGDYLISAAFADNGGSLKWKGDMGVNPVASKGVIAVEGVEIAKMLQLIEGLELPIKLDKGIIETSFAYDFTTPKTIPTLAIKNMTLNLKDIAGKLIDAGGSFALTYAGLSIPQLRFVNNKQPTLQVNDLGFKLLGLDINQAEQMQLILKESTATLPQLDFLMKEAPQLLFNNLQIKLADLQVHKGADFSLQVPTTVVNAVSLDLAENKANIKEVVLSNIDFGKGTASEGETVIQKPLATLNQVALSDSLVLIAEKKVNAESLRFLGFKTSVIKSADGKLNWVEMFASKEVPKAVVNAPANKATVTEGETKEAAWTVGVHKVALSDGNVHVEDSSASTPVVMDIQKASVEIENASLDLSKALPIKAAFNVKQGGRFTTKGQVWPSPLKAKLGMRLSKLSLKPFAPYVNQVALLKLNDGTASVSGKLDLKQQQNFAMSFKGGFDVKRFSLLEEADDAPFLSWNDLSSKSMHLSLMPNKLHIATLQIAKPAGKFIINEDKSMNVTRILRDQNMGADSSSAQVEEKLGPQQAAKPVATSGSLIQAAAKSQPEQSETEQSIVEKSTTVAEPSKDTFPVRIDTVRLSDAALEFADLSLTPQFGTNIHSLNGVINGLSTKAAEVSQVEMDGKVDEYGTARIRGSLQPFSATDFTDIKLAFTNLDMSRMTPYSGKFAGRRIDSGKLSVDLQYKVKQHQLAGENKFVINQLKLGGKVDSTDAADLPLDLAIAILEDSDGVIDLDLPISGSLDDPKFSYGSIFWKAVRNVLTKIVTAPFRALGSIFGGGAEDFDGIAFEAGNSEVSPPELEQLVKLSTALSKRQGLSLGIVPSYHVALDTQAIKVATYRMQVSEEMGLELVEGQKPGPIDLGNEKARDAIDVLHNKLTKKGFFKRMASKFEKPEEGHYEKAQASLIASVEVTQATLKSLAEARGKAILEALLNQNVNEDRLKIMDVTEAKSAKDVVKTKLTLDVKKAGDPKSEAAVSEVVDSVEAGVPEGS